MFTIHVPDTNVSDGSAPISWCFTPEFIKLLTDARVEKPYVYLIVAPASGGSTVKERRYAIPLQSMMAYVQFAGPGMNRVFAFVSSAVCREQFFEPSISYRWMNGYVWYRREWEEEKEKKVALIERKEILGQTFINIMVPSDVFAKEPPVWLATWVNWLFALPPIDSCGFRRRLLMFGAHLQFLVFALIMFLRVVIYVAMKLTLLGNVSARPIIHPFHYDLDGFNDKTTGEELLFLPWKWCKEAKWAFWYLPSTPLMMLVGTLPVMKFQGVWFTQALAETMSVAIAWAVLVTVVALTVKGVRAVRRLVFPSTFESQLRSIQLRVMQAQALEKRAEEKLAQHDREVFWYTDPNAVAPFICTPDAPKAALRSLDDLPPERRTIALRYQALKAWVCKPYAR